MKFTLKSIPISPAKLWYGLPVLIVLIISVILLSKFVLGKSGRVEEALASGQRVEVYIITGEVLGNVRKIIEKEVAKKDEKAKEEEVKEAELEDDFIGPRLPKKEVAKIQRVSLEELGDKPVIVIIIKGLGLSSSTTETALELPPEVTMGFSPYSPSIKEWAFKAKEDGHEILINIPMETRDYRIDDPGPYALLTASSKDDNITRLKMLLSLVDGYRAVYSEHGEMFTENIASIKPILKHLQQQNTYFVFGGGHADFSLIQTANSISYPLLVSDLTIDETITASSISQKLNEIEEIAKSKGYAVAMAHPYPISVRTIERWIPRAQKNGLKIVPVSLLLGKSFN